MGTLYLVATPIGNLEDISRRAISVLQQVDCIAAEDTRHTGRLLAHFEIRPKELVSFHDHSQEAAVISLLERLSSGDLALVSDAGTPGVNDPGFELVRAAIAKGYTVSPVPGPSAPVAALVASGLPTDTFLYLGYLPRRAKERKALLENNRLQPHTLIFLETPHRLLAALADLAAVFPDRQVVVAREMTKLYEEFKRGTAAEILAYYEQHPPKGEITLVVQGNEDEGEQWSQKQLDTRIRDGIAAGDAPSALAKKLAAESGFPRREIYARIQDMNAGEQDV